MSDSLWPRGLQLARLPCPSSSPGGCSNSCPLSQWCHPTILSSVIPFSSCSQSEFPASESFLMSQIISWLMKIKRCLLLERKVMTNLDSISKSRDITLPTKVRLVKAMFFFQWSCMDVRVGLWRKLSAKEMMVLNCGVGEDSWESLGLEGDSISSF